MSRSGIELSGNSVEFSSTIGADAGVLVGRLEKLSTGRNLRLALQATEPPLDYHVGKPDNAVNVAVTTQPAPWTEVELALLTTEELNSLAAISRRLDPDTEGANRLLAPDGKDDAEAGTLPPKPPGSAPT